MSSLIRGDPTAFDVLYDQYHVQLYRTAYLISGNTSDAEDILQETFVTAFTRIKSLKHPNALKGWLFQILTRCAMGTLRRRKREIPDEYALEQSEKHLESFALFRDEYEDTENRLMIGKWLRELPLKHREVIVLFYYNEMTTEEIAKALGILEGTVRSRLFYARRQLRKISAKTEKKGGRENENGFRNHKESYV